MPRASIKKIKDDRINHIIRMMVGSDDIFKLDPVIAGSSALSAYRIVNMYDTDYKWNRFLRKINSGIKNNIDFDKYGDIDMWFLSDNPIHDESNEYNFLLNTDKITAGSAPKINLIFEKSSKWANSYTYGTASLRSPKLIEQPRLFRATSGVPIQMVKTIHKTPQSLLKSFDFINCSVAWHNGILYCDSRLDEAFESFELRLNSDAAYKKNSLPLKVFNALRAFKYSKRYLLGFSEELSEHIFNVYIESEKVDYTKYKEKVIELETLYGKKISSVETFKQMVSSLYGSFKLFSKMDNFKPEYALYMVGLSNDILPLKEYIESYRVESDCVASNELPTSQYIAF